MQEKSLKHSQAKESRKKAPRRRGFLKMFGFLGAGAVVGSIVYLALLRKFLKQLWLVSRCFMHGVF